WASAWSRPPSDHLNPLARGGTGREARVVTSFISHTTIDSSDAYALSVWWQGVLDYRQHADDPNEPGHTECPIFDADTGHTLLFIEVPDPTPGKNRFHLDLRPRDL